MSIFFFYYRQWKTLHFGFYVELFYKPIRNIIEQTGIQLLSRAATVAADAADATATVADFDQNLSIRHPIELQRNKYLILSHTRKGGSNQNVKVTVS
jgi:hypothetical protein